MVEPKGPVFEGNIEEFVVSEGGKTFRILYLPDKNNEELQEAGKSPHYYWLPGEIRLARNAQGHAKFSLLKFQGELSEDTHSGVEGKESMAGGRLSLTTTSKPPDGVLEKAHDKLRDKYRGNDDKYWGLRTDQSPEFGVVTIASNQTTISNIAPQSDGSVPAIENGEERAARADEGDASRSMRSGPRSRPRDRQPTSGGSTERPPGTDSSGSSGGSSGPNDAELVGPETSTRRLIDSPRTVPARSMDSEQRSGLDIWYEAMDGEGDGSIDPAAENAFSATLGSVPTAILWEGFQGQYSPIVVTQYMQLKVWSESIHLKITGDWKQIHTHFSAAVSGGSFFNKAEIQAEMEKLIQDGTIEVELSIDGTTPSGRDREEAMQKRIDLLTEKFMKQAQDVIFEKPDNVEAAKASGGGGFFSPNKFAMKLRRESRELSLSYEESVDERYLLDHIISSSLEGFYDEIKDDPNAEDRYFKTIHLGDMFGKVKRVATPVVRWEDSAKNWVGEPVRFMDVQVGYPDQDGNIRWNGHVFDEGNEAPIEFNFSRKDEGDVSDPPEEWEPDKTFLKRRVHFKEPEVAGAHPYSTVEIEKEIADIDPGERGTLTSNIASEVRADSAGKGYLGPMFLDVELENSKQYIEVAFKADGMTLDGQERTWTRFAWNYEDQDEPRHWLLFTGDPGFVPSFTYQVRVVVKGTIFSSGEEWLGPKNTVNGNGTLKIDVPTPDEAVDGRSLSTREAAGVDPIPATRGEMTVSQPVRAKEGREAPGEAARGDEAVRPPTGREPLSHRIGERGQRVGDGGERSDEARSDMVSDEEEGEKRAVTFSRARGWNVE